MPILEVAEQDGDKASEFGCFADDDAGQPVGKFVSPSLRCWQACTVAVQGETTGAPRGAGAAPRGARPPWPYAAHVAAVLRALVEASADDLTFVLLGSHTGCSRLYLGA